MNKHGTHDREEEKKSEEEVKKDEYGNHNISVRFFNYHMYQRGDTNGLMYVLHLNKHFNDDERLFALFYINEDDYGEHEGEKKQVDARIKEFHLHGLSDRVILVWCSFNGSDLLAIQTPAEASNFLRIRIYANRQIFNANPRRLSLFLTKKENDPSNSLPNLEESIANRFPIDVLRINFKKALRKVLLKVYPVSVSIDKIFFSYIGDSTATLRTRYINKRGYDAVARVLRDLVTNNTTNFHRGNKTRVLNLIDNLRQHYSTLRQTYCWAGSIHHQPKVRETVILFWIRGANASEKSAIFREEKSASVGKPQHHLNFTLYNYVRNLITDMSNELNYPIYFVPIGDAFNQLLSDENKELFTEEKQPYNLINFFRDSHFQGRPSVVQVDFLLRLAEQMNVIQIGMRSGAMERLMLMGVPTIYFDRTQQHPGLANPVGATRISDLSAYRVKPDENRDLQSLFRYFDGYLNSLTRGYKPNSLPLLFHIENTDTGFLSYSAHSNTRLSKNILKLMAHHRKLIHNELKLIPANVPKPPGKELEFDEKLEHSESKEEYPDFESYDPAIDAYYNEAHRLVFNSAKLSALRAERGERQSNQRRMIRALSADSYSIDRLYKTRQYEDSESEYVPKLRKPNVEVKEEKLPDLDTKAKLSRSHSVESPPYRQRRPPLNEVQKRNMMIRYRGSSEDEKGYPDEKSSEPNLNRGRLSRPSIRRSRSMSLPFSREKCSRDEEVKFDEERKVEPVRTRSRSLDHIPNRVRNRRYERIGALSASEKEMLEYILWFIIEIYPTYSKVLKEGLANNLPPFRLRESRYGHQFSRAHDRSARERKKEKPQDNKSDDDALVIGGMFNDEEDSSDDE